jgi:hypothetical protein
MPGPTLPGGHGCRARARLTGPHLARRAFRLAPVGRDGVERDAGRAVAVAAPHAKAAGHRAAHDLHDRVAGQVGPQNLQISRSVSGLSLGGESRTDDERETPDRASRRRRGVGKRMKAWSNVTRVRRHTSRGVTTRGTGITRPGGKRARMLHSSTVREREIESVRSCKRAKRSGAHATTEALSMADGASVASNDANRLSRE